MSSKKGLTCSCAIQKKWHGAPWRCVWPIVAEIWNSLIRKNVLAQIRERQATTMKSIGVMSSSFWKEKVVNSNESGGSASVTSLTRFGSYQPTTIALTNNCCTIALFCEKSGTLISKCTSRIISGRRWNTCILNLGVLITVLFNRTCILTVKIDIVSRFYGTNMIVHNWRYYLTVTTVIINFFIRFNLAAHNKSCF